MNNGLRLTVSSLEWFGQSLFLYGEGWITAIPQIGALSLMLGLVLSLFRRDRRLLFFLIPFVASQAFVFVSGIMDRSLSGHIAGPVVMLFVIGQLLASVYLVSRLAGSRLAATALGMFSVCYALYAGFIAGMSFTGDWI